MRYLALLLVLAGCASTPADDPNAPQAMPADLSGTSPSSDQRIAEMQTAMTELLERLDVLNARIAKLEEAPAPAVASTPAPRTVAPRPAAEAPAPTPDTQHPTPTPAAVRGAEIADAYRKAITLIGGGRTADARRAFQDVFDSDPEGELADNALYWIGETYFASGDYASAMRYYRRVTTEFSDQNKAPDAMYKMAMALAKTGDLALAKRTLEEVIAKYPYSTSAGSAKAELKRIKY